MPRMTTWTACIPVINLIVDQDDNIAINPSMNLDGDGVEVVKMVTSKQDQEPEQKEDNKAKGKAAKKEEREEDNDDDTIIVYETSGSPQIKTGLANAADPAPDPAVDPVKELFDEPVDKSQTNICLGPYEELRNGTF